jgi:hypothetical protein
MPWPPCQGTPGVSLEGAAFTMVVKNRAAKEKLKLIRILAGLFIANAPCPGREGRAQQQLRANNRRSLRNCVFVTVSVEKSKSGHFHISNGRA